VEITARLDEKKCGDQLGSFQAPSAGFPFILLGILRKKRKKKKEKESERGRISQQFTFTQLTPPGCRTMSDQEFETFREFVILDFLSFLKTPILQNFPDHF
jgi:hypothetical protein